MPHGLLAVATHSSVAVVPHSSARNNEEHDCEGWSKADLPNFLGYFDPHNLKLAHEFPDVQFFHPNQPYKEGVHPKNVASYFSSLMKPAYIGGIFAGHTTNSGKGVEIKFYYNFLVKQQET